MNTLKGTTVTFNKERGIAMQYLVTIASLLVFSWVNYQIGFKKGYSEGFEKGANKVVDEWRNWLENVKVKE